MTNPAAHTPEIQRMPQLDTVRAAAVFGVLVAHWSPWVYYGDFGIMGVQCFFVLSGFLISDILFSGRLLWEQDCCSRAFILRRFYARRFLRIFPAYYAVLAICVFFSVEGARAALGWHAAYLTNVYMARVPVETPLNHFWSLAVEEQFYLFWPCVVLWCPRRALFPALCALALMGPAYRAVGTWAHFNPFLKNCQLFSNLDALSLGAILALSRHRLAENLHGPHRLSKILAKTGLWVGGPLLALSILAHAWPWLRLRWPMMYSHVFFGLFFFWLIGRAAEGFTGWPGAVLRCAPLRYFGRISYCVYLLHAPVAVLCWEPMVAAGVSSAQRPALAFALLFLITLSFASLSWYALEQPLNRLKRHFPYAP